MTEMRLIQRGALRLMLCLMVLLHTFSAHALELSFTPSSISGSGDSPLAVVAADFNGDGNTDVAVLSSGSVIRMNGNGDGTFQSASTIYSGSSLVGMTSADFNIDGRPDLAVVSQSNQLVILYNSGSSFSGVNLDINSSGITSIAAGDFDNDSWVDLALLINNGTTVVQFYNYGGFFFSSPDYFTSVPQSSRIKAVNLDNIGASEIMLVPASSQSISFYSVQPSDGTLLAGPLVSLDAAPRSAQLADINGDGTTDLIVLYQNGTAAVLPANGIGGFGSKIPLTTGTAPQDLAAGQFGGDGRLDVIIVNQQNTSTLNTTTLAPVWSDGYPNIGPVEYNSASIYVKSPEYGTVYLVCLPGGSTAPTAQQVKEGRDASGNFTPPTWKSALFDLSANFPMQTGCSSLTAGTAFDLYAVLEQSGVIQPVPVKLSVITPPVTPTQVSFSSIGLTGFTASWSASAGATAYFLDVSKFFDFSTFVGTYNNLNVGNNTTLAISGLDQGTPYYVRVRAAVTGATSSSSYPAGVTTMLPPAVPVLNPAGSVSASGFTVSWQTAANATGYRLDVSSVPGFTSFVGSYNNLNVNAATSQAVTGLTANTPYYFRVRSYNSGATSASSESGTVTTLPPIPAAPTLTTATVISSSGFTANWGTVTHATGYWIDVSTNDSFTGLLPSYSNATAGTGSSFAVSGLLPGGTYYYRVRASNVSGTSASSAPLSVTLLPASPLATAPQNLGTSGFIATWNAVNGAIGYRLDVASDQAFTSFIQGYNNRDVGNVLSFTVTGTESGTTYFYRVRAITSGGTSSSSQIITVFVPELTPIQLAAPRTFLTGSNPAASVTADLNGDGIPDVAVANQSSSTIALFMGNGDGTFRPLVSHITGSQPLRVIAADLNKDGWLDLVTVNYGGGSLSVFMATGSGEYAAASTVGLFASPLDVVAGDFTGDGKLDLAVPSPQGNSVSILPGNGNGTFGQALSTNTDYYPDRLVAADFNGDGKLDLALTTYFSFYTVLLGAGDGTFSTKANYSTTYRTLQIAAGDLSSDGKQDLVVVTADIASGAGTCSTLVLQGGGDGTFSAQTPLPCGTFPQALTLADLNADTNRDILVLSDSGDNLYLFLGNGNSTFQTALQHDTPKLASALAVADFNSDDRLDIGLSSFNDSTFTIFPQNANGTFAGAPAASFTADGLPVSLAAGDFNKDGHLDVAGSINISNKAVAYYGNGGGSLTSRTPLPLINQQNNYIPSGILAADLNNDGSSDIVTAGYGTITIAAALSTTGNAFMTPTFYQADTAQQRAASGDFNGDGNLDVVVANTYSAFGNDISLFLGNGDGTFQTGRIFAAGANSYDVVADDFNGDGSSDLAVVNTSGTVSILLGNGNGNLAAPVAYPVGTAPYYASSGDFNRDGKRDLTVSNSNDGTVSILSGNGDGTFQAAVDFPAGGAPKQLITTDLNGDGLEDLITANGHGGYITALLGKGDGTFLPAQHFWSNSTSTLTTGIFSGSGRIDIAVADGRRGGVKLLSNTSEPALAAGYPTVVPVTSTSASVLAQSSVAGTVYAVCLPSGSSAPTTTQIKAGQDSTGTPLANGLKGSTPLTAQSEGSIPLTTLSPGGNFDIYVVFEVLQPFLTQVPHLLRLNQPASVPQSLTVTVTGVGTVISSAATAGSPSDISCSSGTCSASYPEGSTVTLTASPSWYSNTGWGGVDSSTTNSATVAMNNKRTVTAHFAAAQNVQVSNPAGYHGSIKTALDTAADGATVKARAMPFPDVFTLNRPGMSFTLLGGFSQLSDSAPNGVSTIPAPFTISGGRLNIDGTIKITP